MFVLYFDNAHWDYHRATYYRSWVDYDSWRPGETAWLIPGTDPDDPLYCW